ncbi:MAG TPA: multicopper oxidase domain-containing protein [Verrucomicrobiae bacterium]|nr:multicopper oxidase domain-containing protein [Verrucomicrobiae bacterium]
MVRILIALIPVFLWVHISALAKSITPEICPRPIAGSRASEPEDVTSDHGVLKVTLKFLTAVDSQGRIRYCYISKDGAQAPTLRVNPGDTLILNLENDIAPDSPHGSRSRPPMQMQPDSCSEAKMTASSTNLHFHGLMIPPVCHQDDVLHTVVGPSAAPFEYRFRIPDDQPPGLYWYHPHLHGFSKAQVLGGASGALIVEGIERVTPQLAGLPERVLVIRDQDLINPDAQPTTPDSAPHTVTLRDAEGDILNTGTDGGKPAKDLSLNFVPVAFPDYKPALVEMKPAARELWRVLNASGITYVDLQVLYDASPQPLGVAALDGVPIDDNGVGGRGLLWKTHILVPPAGRVEFILKGPPLGAHATLMTRGVDTGPAGENDPSRPLATIVAVADAPEPRFKLAAAPTPLRRQSPAALRDVAPVRVRKLYFSEKPQNPADPNSPTVFFITVEGQPPAPFDPASSAPNITVRQGDVEDWIIENRSQELHAFHIHQIHFMLLDWNGVPVDEPFLRDTVNVAYWDGKSPSYPSVKLRMDFRDRKITGTFVYHCHLLEHEDGGMMGTIRVIPPVPSP